MEDINNEFGSLGFIFNALSAEVLAKLYFPRKSYISASDAHVSDSLGDKATALRAKCSLISKP